MQHMGVEIRCSECSRTMAVVGSDGTVEPVGYGGGLYATLPDTPEWSHDRVSSSHPVIRCPNHGWRGPLDKVGLMKAMLVGEAPAEVDLDELE